MRTMSRRLLTAALGTAVLEHPTETWARPGSVAPRLADEEEAPPAAADEEEDDDDDDLDDDDEEEEEVGAV